MRIIAQLSDIHLGETIVELQVDPKANLVRVLEDVKARGIKEIIITGDICSGDIAGWLRELLTEYELEYSLIPGNHDDPAVIKDVFGIEHNYYSYSGDNHRYFFLDSGQGLIDQAQLCWLRDELSKVEENDVVIFIHHPILDCDNSIMDRLYPLLNRSEVELLINGAGQKIAVFCGHYHRNDVREKGNIKQYVAPSTFYQLKQHGDELEIDKAPIGYRIIKIDREIETEVIGVPGT